MSAEEPKAPDAEGAEGAEGTPSAEAPRSEESASAAGPEATRGASAEDAPSPPHGDELSEAVDEVAASDDEEPEAQEPVAPAPAPTRRRSRRDPDEPAPVVRAQAKYVRSSARKARLVCDHIRGKSVDEARAILAVTPRAIARDWSKLLESAIANAEHNHELVGEDLYVKAVHADEGPTIKRFRPRAMGRATRIRKRTSHLTILLTPKD